MSRYKKHWGFRTAGNSHQTPKLHQSWWQSLSEPLVPPPSLCHFRSQWPQGDKQGGVMVLYFPLRLCLHTHTVLLSTSMIWSQLLQLLKTTTGRDFLRSRAFSPVWPLSVLIPSAPRPGCCVNMELRSHPDLHIQWGARALSAVQGTVPKHTGFYPYLFFLFSFLLPPSYTGRGRYRK